MKISVIGMGYVGLSNAVLLSQKHEVATFDIDKSKVAKDDSFKAVKVGNKRSGKSESSEVGSRNRTEVGSRNAEVGKRMMNPFINENKYFF